MSTLSTTAAAAATGKPSWGRLVGWGLFLAILAWSWKGAEMNPAVLFRDAGNMATFAADFFPPDFGNWKLYLSEMLVTVQIALWGTVLAIVCAIPLSILASENIVPWWVYQPVRRVMDACRSINEMVFAMLFVVAVGLGPFAGVLALFISTTGVLAKLFAEAVEAIDPGPVEGVRATGASALQEVIFGGHPAGPAAVDLLFAVPLRVQRTFRHRGRDGRRRRHRRDPLGGHPRLPVRPDLRRADRDHRGGEPDRRSVTTPAQAVHLTTRGGRLVRPFQTMHLSRQSEPLYRELAERLRQELLAYRPGDYLPGEIQLAQRFAVNRHTLRRALDELVLEGRVLRRQGKGTQVLEAPTIYPMGAANAYTESLSAQGHRVEARLLEARQRPAGAAEATHLGIGEGGRVLELTTLRYLDGQPVSLIRHCYAVSRSELLADYQGGSLRRYLADKGLPLTRTYSLIGARLPNREEAARLLMPRHAPLLTVLTLSRDRTGQPVELAQSISRADRFQYQVAP